MDKLPGHARTPAIIFGLIALLCVCAGTLARFAGLGKWPFAIDEYYFAQSVQNVLRVGLPQYACGGFYTRGLLLQYCAALLQLLGLSAELAPRLIAALSSLIALPAVFILAKRVGGRTVALLALSLMALSVWEVEIGRLGRMYAPFQALFLWYLVFFLEYTLDRRHKALAPMLALSVIGVFVWEGGVFLALANLLPPLIRNPSGRLQRRDWLYLAAAALPVVPLYWLATADLRDFGGEPALPADYQSFDAPSASPLDAGIAPVSTLLGHPFAALVALLPLAMVLFAVFRLTALRLRPSAVLGLIAALLCALLQQFGLAAAIVLLLLLFSMLEWGELTAPSMRPVLAALAMCAIYWVAFATVTSDWHSQTLSPLRSVLLLGYEFVRLPDFVREIAIPWGRAVPTLAVGLLVLLIAACLHSILRPASTPASERVALALLVLLLLAASASHPPRHETRYAFFLYPLATILALTMLARAIRALSGTARYMPYVIALAACGGFALSEDFRPAHLWNIDTAAVNFRIGMNGRSVAHYHPRTDVRSAAEWLRANVQRTHDLVVSSFPGLDFYYAPEDYFYMERTDPRYEGWACRAGTRERWGDRPLISSLPGLATQVSAQRTVWLVIEPLRAAQLAKRLAVTAPEVRMLTRWTAPGGDISVVALQTLAGAG